ncbi:MAG: DUF2390 domain-containing protein [Halomonadaceae bacterium]|nr:MAG: DUF2390 domain-containing protein [Halomonadaceae bacterium]
MIRQHPPADLALDNPLWQLAGRYWQVPAFEAACLNAQGAGWSVSHILVALYSSERGLAWDGVEPAVICHWRQDVTEPLRALRQALNREQATVAALRQCCKQAELEAERLELAWWHALISQAREPQNAPEPKALPTCHWQVSLLAHEALVRDNLDRLFQGSTAPLSQSIISAIAQGALPS